MKLCKDCKHIIAYQPLLEASTCRKDPKEANLVTGEPGGFYACAATRQAQKTGCGKEAKWFEPKEQDGASHAISNN